MRKTLVRFCEGLGGNREIGSCLVYSTEIHMVGNEVLKGKIKTVEEGHLMVEPSAEREATIIDWSKVQSINPPPIKWKGSVTVGANLQSGNTDRMSASVGGKASRRTERDRFSLRFLYNYAEEDEELTARNTYGALKYDYFLRKSLYSYLGVELLSDEFKDLNLRTVVGPGIGYQIWDDEVKSLLFEMGVAYFSEDLDEGEDDSWITARLAAELSWKIFGPVVFSEYLVINPALKEFGEYELRNEASLSSHLAVSWALKLTNIVELDSDPPAGVKKSDTYFILGLQYSF